VNLFRGQKVKVTKPNNAVTDNAQYPDLGHYSLLKIKLVLPPYSVCDIFIMSHFIV